MPAAPAEPEHLEGEQSLIGEAEVWRFHARRRTLIFLVLGEDGSYQSVPRSRNLPLLTPPDVLAQLKLAEEMNGFSRWFLQLAEWARITIAPRAEDKP